jgi:hypothetical protein
MLMKRDHRCCGGEGVRQKAAKCSNLLIVWKNVGRSVHKWLYRATAEFHLKEPLTIVTFLAVLHPPGSRPSVLSLIVCPRLRGRRFIRPAASTLLGTVNVSQPFVALCPNERVSNASP